MTLRQVLGSHVGRLHDLLDEFLDREDAVVLLVDGNRVVNYMSGFGMSPSQHELLALEIERLLRASGATSAPAVRGWAKRREDVVRLPRTVPARRLA